MSGQTDGQWPWDRSGSWHEAVEWEAEAPDAPPVPSLLRAAAAELRIGRPARAVGLLEGISVDDPSVSAQVFALRAAAADALGDPLRAGDLYLQAGDIAAEPARGVLAARAGAAFERAGDLERARDAYLRAAARLPVAAGWMRLRAAGVSATAGAVESLLVAVPRAGVSVSQQVRAAAWLHAGDTAAAIQSYTVAGAFTRAAGLALRLGDSALARTLAYRGLTGADTAGRREAIEMVEASLRPRDATEFMGLARAWAGRRDVRRAARYGREAIAAGDSSAAAANTVGEWVEQSGDRRAALEIYARGGADGAYRRARGLLRLGRRAEAAGALIAFATEHTTHRWAPLALYLAADSRGSDSLFRAVAERWPSHAYASRARFRLATRFLRRADTVAAIDLYASEVAALGENARHARYLLARLRLARGEQDVARAAFGALARDDSIGYYGTIARAALALPPPVFEPAVVRTPTDPVRRALRELDILEAAGFTREVDLLVADLMDREWADADEMLDLAEGLIGRGYGPLGVRLGWRATRTLTLNHPRVIRVVFPWPAREMIEREARKFDLDPYLLAAMIRQESAFQAGATSRAGARGFMQLMPATARGVARRLQVPWNETMFGVADANVHLGAAHLAGLFRQFDGDIIATLAAYNAGGTPVRRWLRYPEASDPAFFVERIPYVETRGYVQTVTRNHLLYRALYPPDR